MIRHALKRLGILRSPASQRVCVAPQVAPTLELVPSAAPAKTARVVSDEGVVLITTGLLNHKLGITLTAGFVRSLGFQPIPQPRAGTWWRESDLKPISAALIEFLRARDL